MFNAIYEVELDVLYTISWHTVGSQCDAAHKIQINAIICKTKLLRHF